jgi:hypothetical protein
MLMRRVGGLLLFAAVALLLLVSNLVSAGSRTPLADPTPTAAAFLPNIYREWARPTPAQEPEVSDLRILGD